MKRKPSKSQQSTVPKQQIVRLQLCVGVFSSQWYFWAEKDVAFHRVPMIGEWIQCDDRTDRNQIVESVTWRMDGAALVCVTDFYVAGEGIKYGRNVARALKRFRDDGWDVEVPRDVTMPSI